MPSTAEDAYDLLEASVKDPNPVIYLEHRWLHNLKVKKEPILRVKRVIGEARLISQGKELTIVAMGYVSVEAMHSLRYLQSVGVEAELIDIGTIVPMDWYTIFESIKKTGRLLVLDTSHEFCSVGSEIIAKVSCDMFEALKAAPIRMNLPNAPEPTSYGLTGEYHVRAGHITYWALKLLGKLELLNDISIKDSKPHDVPGDWFKGPF